MQKILICILLIGISVTVKGANRLRVLLDNGWVVSLSGDGEKLIGKPQLLDLPKGSSGIYIFTPDYLHNRLYVTPQLAYTKRGTVVFDLTSLKKLGFMPGVTEVTIPIDSRVTWLTAKTFVIDDVSRQQNLSSIEQLHEERAGSLIVELRDRSAWSKVNFKKKEKGISFESNVLWRCYSEIYKGFLSGNPYAVFDNKFEIKNIPKVSVDEDKIESLEASHVTDCWNNGDSLLVNWGGESFSSQYFPGGAEPSSLTRQSIDGKIKKFVSDGTWRLRYDHSETIALGRDSRYAAYLKGDNDFMLFDFEAMIRTTPDMVGNPRFGQFSSDRDEWYLENSDYEYKGGVDVRYITGMYGGRTFGGNLMKLSVKNGIHIISIQFPEELTEIRRRFGDINIINDRDDLGEDEKKRLIDALPPLGPIAQLVKRFDIVGALAD